MKRHPCRKSIITMRGTITIATGICSRWPKHGTRLTACIRSGIRRCYMTSTRWGTPEPGYLCLHLWILMSRTSIRSPFKALHFIGQAILRLGEVEIEQAVGAFTADGVEYPKGSYVVRVAQPFGAFAKTMMEKQVYPDLREYPGGPPQPVKNALEGVKPQ